MLFTRLEAQVDADFVVVGSGIGGVTAAMLAAELAPDAHVLVEKCGFTGGNGNYAEILRPRRSMYTRGGCCLGLG